METVSIQKDKTLAAFVHISTFSKYFIPFGNFILPLILWTAKKNDPFVDENGKRAINFQISVFLYFILLGAIGISGLVYFGIKLNWEDPIRITEHLIHVGSISGTLPIFILLAIIGILFLGLFVLEIVCVISATIKASEGEIYKYPLSINFIPLNLGKPEKDL